jgi:hypothetical protein
MQVLCMPSQDSADIECEICGQKYLLFFTRSSENERAEGVLQVARALETHHKFGITASVHPQNAFNVPEWEGMASASAAALLGGAFARK